MKESVLEAEVTVLLKKSQDGDKTTRDELILNNLGLVHHIVKRYLGRGYDAEELFQIGVIGLMKAVDHFDTTMDVKFSTYAVPLIMGEIRRFIRDNGSIKVSRTIKENAYKIHKEAEEYTKKTGQEPSIKELEKITGLNEEEIIQANESCYEVESIYQTTYQKDGSELMLVDKLANEKEEQENSVNRIIISKLLSEMEALDRKLLWLRYYENCTQSQVADILGISQVQVSRREKKLLLWMRSKI